MEIIHTHASTIRLLKSMGFVHYSDAEYELNNIKFDEDDIVMVESDFKRNLFVIVLHSYEDYTVYVQYDAGCELVEMPLRWSKIEQDWLKALMYGFNGNL